MTKQKRRLATIKLGGTGEEQKLPPGVKLVQTLAGQKGVITSVAFDPQGRMLASGSEDATVKLWDTTSGKLLRSLKGHKEAVSSVTFDPLGCILASGSNDQTVKLWDATSGMLLRTLKGHKDAVNSIAFDPRGFTLASGSSDGMVKLWSTTDGNLLRSLAEHTGSVYSVAFDPKGMALAAGTNNSRVILWDAIIGNRLYMLKGHKVEVVSIAFDPSGRMLASGSWDNTIKLWKATNGKLLRTLEGHIHYVDIVAFSADGRLLASRSRDNTIRIWNCATWETVAVISEPTPPGWIPALTFHPTLPLLATAGSTKDTPHHYRSRLIHIYELDLDVLLGCKADFQPATATAHHTTAKVVLVGDTGVGKSAMAERLVQGKFVETRSTHARRAMLLETEKVAAEQGTVMHRDTVLWDLAGQPAYRLVHQLSMDDAAVACVLFDARSETNPFEGAAYWSQVLKQARTRTKLVRLLVASRTDVGGLPASLERINAFAQEHGFDRVFQTSAFTGEGCPELLAAIKQAIPWDDLPAVSSSEVLAQLRDFVGRLKGTKEPRPNGDVPPLLTIAELQRRFEADSNQKISQEDFIAYLGRLEDSDEIDVLAFDSTGQVPRAEDQVLLDPTRIDAYASALLVAAKDEPDGPGHLLESRIHQGDFKLEQSERLANKEFEKHVLWYVMENLFAHDLALLETIQDKEYVVFPAQCTSPLTFPGGTAFGVALGMAGPIRSIYATLIAQLAHYEGFAKREFFQDAAAYHTKTGKRCLVRLQDKGDGTGELQVSFDEKTETNVRQGFLEFIEQHVEAKANPDSMTKRHAYHCHQCLTPFEDKTVRKRLTDKRTDLLCPECEARTPLVNLLSAPTASSTKVAETIDANAKAGRFRITAANEIKAKEAEGKYDVFLSHNSKDKDEVEKIARRLKSVGLRPWLDKWDLVPGDTIMKALGRAIETIPCAALFFGSTDVGDWHVMEIQEYVARWAKHKGRFIPTILPGVEKAPELPPFVGQTLWVDMREWEQKKHDGFYRLVCGIIGRRPGDSPLSTFNARNVWDWQQE